MFDHFTNILTGVAKYIFTPAGVFQVGIPLAVSLFIKIIANKHSEGKNFRSRNKYDPERAIGEVAFYSTWSISSLACHLILENFSAKK